MVMLKANDIGVLVNGKTLVNGVSVGIEPGKVCAIVGANGAGKSTLLRVLCGEISPQQGNVSINNRPLEQWAARDQAKLRAILPQSASLSFAFRVIEVVLMGRSPHINGSERPQDYEVSMAALEAVDMADFAERSYLTLSGGERQRIHLARVLAQIWEESPLGARYLLLDEPTNNLDITHQHRTLQVAQRFAKQGVGVLTVLHDLNLAAQYADQVMVMKGGQALAVGTPHEVFTPSTIQEAFSFGVVVIPHPCFDCPLIVSR